MEKKTLGMKLKEFRLSKGMKLQQIAKEMGVSAGFLSEVERDKKVPGGEFFISLKRIYGVSIDYLLDDSYEAISVSEPDTPYIISVAEIMRSMDQDTQKDICLSVEKEKLLRDLLRQSQEKNTG